jgi:hypothetical protein
MKMNIFVFAVTAKTMYPYSIKFARKYLHLKGFLNLNMASLPPILITSGITCGIY